MNRKEYQHKIYLESVKDPIKKAKRRKTALEWYHVHKNDPDLIQRRKQKHAEYYEKNKKNIEYLEMNRSRGRSYILKIKTIVMWHYSKGSMSCNCCGIKDLRFLTVDHIENNGGKLRHIHGTGTKFYSWLIKNNMPNEFQILCWNCNSAKALNNGICPHKDGIAGR